ncbi:Os02g0140000 [Oryza sativa Japonica Group]|uniref:Os02g0140000 protein n=1 Tax=Oryza sativa subsp. japonica TaxID=39947 RepID=A0A0P0VEM9_ORYSJ|nr:Os02g0140000 [Oryza sativa Japonica Group]
MGHAAAADPAASASRPHQEAAAGEQGKQGAGEQEIVSVEELAELDSGDHNRSLAAMPVSTASSPPLPTSRRSKDVELHHPSSRIAARPPPNSSRAAPRPSPRAPPPGRLPPPPRCATPLPPPSRVVAVLPRAASHLLSIVLRRRPLPVRRHHCRFV